MPKQALFRADGNSSTGLGHLYRTFALIGMLRPEFDCVLITRADTVRSVIPESIKEVTIPTEVHLNDEPEWLRKEFRGSRGLVVVDGYQFTSSYQKRIKEQGFWLVSIDDLAQEHMYADLVINHAPSALRAHYSAESYTKFALGTGFALVRPAFLNLARSEREIQDIDTAFVCFGGSDPQNYTAMAIEALSGFPRLREIHLVVGAAFTGNITLEAARKVTRHADLNEAQLARVMLSCQLAVVSASTVFFEICCVKMPAVIGYYVENQEKAYHSFVSDGLAEGAGNLAENGKINLTEAIARALNQPPTSYVKTQQRYFDGNQGTRIINLIKEINGH
jgi:UDP-2,4-diacetamido-2,4,6-trideoxy-beta-L-altropyranose hydrolase